MRIQYTGHDRRRERFSIHFHQPYEMPKMNHDGAEGSEVFEGFRLVSKEDAEEYLCKGRDEHGMYYPLFTWAALMFFMGV